MILLQAVGYFFLLVASISSSISMNFQKLAQYELHYVDPRTRLVPRKKPLETSVFCRPLFTLAIFLSFAASTLDFLALTWLPPLTVGIFGCVSIIVNLVVSRVILFEKPNPKEWCAITLVIFGCLISISAKVSEIAEFTPPQLIERTTSCIYIVSNWVVFISMSIALEHGKLLPPVIQRFGFPFIGGALGAQNVCMGKYIAWAVEQTIEVGHLAVRADVLAAVVGLCVSSVIVHVYWLNRGLEKHDAYFCIIVYQTSWFFFTTLSGIVVYDNMAKLNLMSQLTFFVGCFLAMFGVWKISELHD